MVAGDPRLDWVWILLLAAVVDGRSTSTLRFSDSQLSHLMSSSDHERFLDTVLASPLEPSLSTGEYHLVAMVTCPPVKAGCPFATPGSGVVSIMDDDSPYSADDVIASGDVDVDGRFNLRGSRSDPFWNTADPYLFIRVLCPHSTGGYDQLQWHGPTYPAADGYAEKYMVNEREMEFHFAEDGRVVEYRDMDKFGRELMYDSCLADTP